MYTGDSVEGKSLHLYKTVPCFRILKIGLPVERVLWCRALTVLTVPLGSTNLPRT